MRKKWEKLIHLVLLSVVLLFSVQAAYGFTPGELKWKFLTGSRVWGSYPAIGEDGTIYFGSEDGYVYAINTDGIVKWKFDTGNFVDSSPAIGSDGTVYVGSNDDYLYAIKPDGTLKWKYETGGWITSSPAIGSDGTVYVGSWDGYLYAIAPDGTLKWKYETGGSIVSSPAIGSDGTVYVGSEDDYLYAIAPDGTLKWKYETGGLVGSPTLSRDGILYVGSWDNNLYAIYTDSQGLANSSWPIFHHDIKHTGRMASQVATNNSTNFSDISPSDWYYTYVEDIAKAGITTGYPDGTYKPSALVTRAQMAAFIARAMKLNVPNECNSSPFYDVDTNTWYCKYVEAIKSAGITTGYPDGSYKPDGYVTRAEMAAFLVKALHLNTQPCTTKPFVDVETDAWYCPYVQALKNAGITKGYPDGTYRPDEAVTRAEMAVFIDRAFLGGN